LSTPVAVEIVPLPSFSEPVQTALALLAIVPPWGFLNLYELRGPMRRSPEKNPSSRHNAQREFDAPEACQDALSPTLFIRKLRKG
jgi:hypothetical protein